MWISGAGINTFQVLRFKSKPRTKPAIKWIQVSNNDWESIDRGASNDIYQSTITFYGNETEIDNIIDELELNRQNGANFFTIDDFNEVDDQLFGADIDYSGPLEVTVTKWGKRKQKQLKSFIWEITLQLVEDPYLYNGTPSLPTLRPFIGYSSYSTWELQKLSTYDNSFTYIDHDKDSGIFEGTFIMSQAEMKAFRRYILSTIRDSSLTLTAIAGVTNPFGPKRGGFPITAYVLDFKDELLNINYWTVKVKFAEVI